MLSCSVKVDVSIDICPSWLGKVDVNLFMPRAKVSVSFESFPICHLFYRNTGETIRHWESEAVNFGKE